MFRSKTRGFWQGGQSGAKQTRGGLRWPLVQLIGIGWRLPGLLFGRGEERVLVQQSPDAVAVVTSATKTETAFLTRDDVLNTFVLNEPQDLEHLLQTVATAWKSAAIAQPDCR